MDQYQDSVAINYDNVDVGAFSGDSYATPSVTWTDTAANASKLASSTQPGSPDSGEYATTAPYTPAAGLRWYTGREYRNVRVLLARWHHLLELDTKNSWVVHDRIDEPVQRMVDDLSAALQTGYNFSVSQHIIKYTGSPDTANEIAKAIKKVAGTKGEMDERDLLIFFYIGHGGREMKDKAYKDLILSKEIS
jgi:hypothetical protein